MVREWSVGRIGEVEMTVRPAALGGSLLLWVLLGGVAFLALDLPLVTASAVGAGGVALHWLSSLAHNLGHAWAARRTGYPMIGIRFGVMAGLLAQSRYPRDEPPLPPEIHIRRALGGPIANLLLAALAAGLLPALAAGGSAALWWLGVWFFVENFFIYALQVVVPIGFNDGATILHALRERSSRSP